MKMVEKEMGAAGRTRDGDGGGGEEAAAAVEEISVKMDPRVLECPICFEALKPPIFQCEVGHVVCSPCHEELRDRCLLCCKTTGHSRCLAIEQFIDAIRVPCPNARYGCGEFMPVHRREEHEAGGGGCAHAPCSCPVDGCAFRAPPECLAGHLAAKHGAAPTNFHYGKRCGSPCRGAAGSRSSSGKETCPCSSWPTPWSPASATPSPWSASGRPVHRPVMTSSRGGRNYSCKISAAHRATGGRGRLVSQTDPCVASSSLSGGVELGEFFLLVPPELVDKLTDQLAINIRIDQLALK